MTPLQKSYSHGKGSKNARKKVSPSVQNIKMFFVNLCIFAVQKTILSEESVIDSKVATRILTYSANLAFQLDKLGMGREPYLNFTTSGREQQVGSEIALAPETGLERIPQ